MYPPNLQRMIQLAEEFFEMKNDPAQISVTGETRALLEKLDPDTMSEISTEQGPVAWILVFPTTKELMEQFVSKKVNEQELLVKTPLGVSYEAIYLCSALVLPEYRGKGLVKQLAQKAIQGMMGRYPIRHLFYWGFSPEGDKLASWLAREFDFPLLQRPD